MSYPQFSYERFAGTVLAVFFRGVLLSFSLWFVSLLGSDIPLGGPRLGDPSLLELARGSGSEKCFRPQGDACRKMKRKESFCAFLNGFGGGPLPRYCPTTLRLVGGAGAEPSLYSYAPTFQAATGGLGIPLMSLPCPTHPVQGVGLVNPASTELFVAAVGAY